MSPEKAAGRSVGGRILRRIGLYGFYDMKLWRWLFLPALAALALLLYGGGFTSVAAPPDDPPDFAPGELLVKARPWVSEATATAAMAAEGASAAERLLGLDVYRVGLPPGVGVAEAADFYERLSWVEFAEPNYYIRADVVPDDPCHATGSPCPSTQQWYYDLIEAPAAWDITSGSSSIVVAVVDTGVDLDHPDLDGKLEAGAAFISCVDDPESPGPDCDFFPSLGCSIPSSNNPNDDEGHGTFVAGVVGAETNNGTGVAGTAWGVRLMPVKVLDCKGVGLTSDVALGIAHAAANGADVINLSLGGRRVSPQPCGSTLGDAITNAIGAGAVLVAASGNENVNEVSCPAAHPRVIAVGASGGQSNPDARADCPSESPGCFSNWGPEIDVVAPGVSICSTSWKSGAGSTYACGGGTSFAAPLVSGLAVLILSENPSFGYQEVRSVLCASALDLPDGSTPGWDGCGRIDMEGALTVSLPSDPGVVSWGDGRIDVFVRALNDALRHRWFVRGKGWSGWENLGGVLNSGPDASSRGEGRLDVFALGADGTLRHKWYARGQGWSGWENLGAPSGKSLTSDPGVVSWGDGRIDVFARASGGALWHRWFVQGEGWSGWENLGGVLNSGPDVSTWGEGRLDVFALGADGKLQHKWYARGQGWSGWENLGAPSGESLTSDPGVVSWGDGRIDLFARASDSALWHRWFVQGKGWLVWETLGGVLNTGPDPSSWTSGRLDIFALGEHNQLRHRWFAKGSGWHPKGSLENLASP